ncbi:MAG TPA: LPS export ABC transporter permease LptG [Thermoanaerobaculia bacterium]|nr:LPS export ABC transporter permease LptG [Thermoanaerobaculia bacterium]
MSILNRYILKEMIGPTLLGLVFYTSIILMQNLFEMAGLIIRRSLPGGAVLKLLLYSLPHIIVLTVPMALLFGILIAVGRLSSDSEIVAMRALGISTRTIYRPVFYFSVAIFLLNLYLINFVMPQGNRQFVALSAELLTAAADKVVKPRIFQDVSENLMVYVSDIDPVTGQWKGVFLADSRNDPTFEEESTSPSQMSGGGITAPQEPDDTAALSHSGSGQRIVTARSGGLAIVGADKKIWMNLTDAETHVWDPRKPDRYDHTGNETQRILVPSAADRFDRSRLAKSFREMDLRELLSQERNLRHGRTESDRIMRNLARVEIHKKFAIPFACIALGILGLPLGITNRRGGKSSGFSLSIAIIVVYYVLINNGEQLAVNGKIPAALGMWGANVLILAIGLYLLSRANRDFVTSRPDGTLLQRTTRAIQARLGRRRKKKLGMVTVYNDGDRSLLNRLDITFPNILDRYILREFLKVLALVLISVIALFVVVDYTETAKDARENGVAASVLLTYYRFQIFSIINWTLPISVLVATLVTFAMLSKNNEVTAIKSSGVSLYRIALPVIAVAAVMSLLAYFVLDFVLPYANDRAAETKRRIEGKPVVTNAAQQKLWYLGKGHYIINFLAYEPANNRLTQVQVFEFDPNSFRLTRRVYANRATWNGRGWTFEDGWMRSFLDDKSSTFSKIEQPLPLFYSETPEDFATEVKPPEQMTYAQLRRYIQTLRESGYAADALTVKLYEKTSWPVISMVMALIAMPFAFKLGRRGALYGVSIALVVGIVYWMVFRIFTNFGEVGNLPPLLSAWAANILFALAAGYLFLKVET